MISIQYVCLFVCLCVYCLFVCVSICSCVAVSFCVGVILYLCRFVPVMYRLILVTPALGNVYFRNGFIFVCKCLPFHNHHYCELCCDFGNAFTELWIGFRCFFVLYECFPCLHHHQPYYYLFVWGFKFLHILIRPFLSSGCLGRDVLLYVRFSYYKIGYFYDILETLVVDNGRFWLKYASVSPISYSPLWFVFCVSDWVYAHDWDRLYWAGNEFGCRLTFIITTFTITCLGLYVYAHFGWAFSEQWVHLLGLGLGVLI